jgi:hypothetical protein
MDTFPTGPRVSATLRKAGIKTRIVGKNGYGQVLASLVHNSDEEEATAVLAARFPGRKITSEVYDHPTGVYRHVSLLVDQT